MIILKLPKKNYINKNDNINEINNNNLINDKINGDINKNIIFRFIYFYI